LIVGFRIMFLYPVHTAPVHMLQLATHKIKKTLEIPKALVKAKVDQI
jgi:hypothetical protein